MAKMASIELPDAVWKMRPIGRFFLFSQRRQVGEKAAAVNAVLH